MLIKSILFFFSFIPCHLLLAQNPKVSISGKLEINKPLDGDTIYFSKIGINTSAEEKPISAMIKDKAFKASFPIPYPSLFYYTISGDKQKGILGRKGDLFIDNYTKKIFLSVDERTESIDGVTYSEYKNKFLPFFVSQADQINKTSIEQLIYKNKEFDNKLLHYSKSNPKSYVALWALVLAVNENSYRKIYEEILQNFDSELKRSLLWKQLYTVIGNYRLKEGGTFPRYNLKTIDGQPFLLDIPKDKTVLVDLWFSRCKPCLELLPDMKKLYENFKDSKFEIISIATDKTSDIPILKKRINDHNLIWLNLLDENGVETKKDNILVFPTNFLIENGVIVQKNITLKDLEIYLTKKAEAEKLIGR